MRTPIGNGEMDSVPPYAPNLRWYALWYSGRLHGMTDEDAVWHANRLCDVGGKEYARCCVRSASGRIWLSVAVDGGSGGLRRRGAEKTASVSLHGRWPHVHLGALEASYGRSPYYQHVAVGIRDILENVAAGDSLGALNRKIHAHLSGFLTTGVDKEALYSEAVRMRGPEIAADLEPELSLIDALMYYGPETSLALLCYNSENF